MIFYTTTDGNQKNVYFVIAALSIAISSGLMLLDLKFITKFIVPSGFLIYGILILLLEKWLWRKFPMKYLIKIPNLNGYWTGKNTMSNFQEEDLEVNITQTWSKLDIVVETSETVSHLCAATFNTDNEKSYFLQYIYNVKSTNGDDSNRYGEGCGELRYKTTKNGEILQGKYFSSKLRGGTFKIFKQT